jgi:hypothetical protein
VNEVNLAGIGIDDFDLLVPREGNACARQLRFDADRGLVVVQEAIDHGLAEGVGENRIAEDLHHMEGWRGGQTDFDGVEVFQHATVF